MLSDSQITNALPFMQTNIDHSSDLNHSILIQPLADLWKLMLISYNQAASSFLDLLHTIFSLHMCVRLFVCLFVGIREGEGGDFVVNSFNASFLLLLLF